MYRMEFCTLGVYQLSLFSRCIYLPLLGAQMEQLGRSHIKFVYLAFERLLR